MAKPKCYIGTSGYSYNHWKEVFYPKGTPSNRWLEFYCKNFDTVELNVTFYRLPKIEVYKSWYKRTPRGFSFSVKGSRFITHIKRLRKCKDAIKTFFDRGPYLKEKVSCVLWQLPPRFKKDGKVLSNFIKQLPKVKRVRHAFEFRDESWYSSEIFDILHDNNMALCSADWPGFSNKPLYDIADFIYIRRHGQGAVLYGGCYSKVQLRKDRDVIREALLRKKDIYIYYNNDANGNAPRNALWLKKILT